jgi:ribosomal protein L31E
LTVKQDENRKHQAEHALKIIHNFTQDLAQQNKIKVAISISQTVFKVGKAIIWKNTISLGVILFEGIFFEIHDENIHNKWVPRIK